MSSSAGTRRRKPSKAPDADADADADASGGRMVEDAGATGGSGEGREVGLWERVKEFVFLFTMVHYFVWIFVFIAVGYLVHRVGPLGQVLVYAAVLAYLPSFVDGCQYKLGRTWHSFRTSRVWELAHRYMSLESIRLQQLDPAKKYVFGFHPHGILILSRVATYGGIWERLFPGIETRCLGASPMFYVPGAREICLWMGAVDAGRNTARHVLRQDTSIIVYPGGSKEIFSTDAESKDTTLVLEPRNGFIKLAMQEGATLVPVFVFGEKWMYNRLNLPPLVRHVCLNVLRIPLIVFWGRFFTWMPRRSKMGIVYGAPVDTPHLKDPSNEQVQEVKARYRAAVQKLYDDHRKHFGYADDERLVIT